MRIFPVIPLLVLISSCSALSDKKEDKKTAAESTHRTLSQRLDEKNGYKQDANGNWVPQSDKRSSFESKGESPYVKGDLAKREYHAGDYAKKSWTGATELKSKTYQGNTDASRFQTANRLSDQKAREFGSRAKVKNYKTQDYKTSTASEGGKKIAKPSDAVTDERRKVFASPDVIDWQAQRQMSMEESRSILGR